MASNNKTIKVEQTGSPQRRHTPSARRWSGSASTRSAASRDLPDTPMTRGMIRKVQHLVRSASRRAK